MKPDIIIFNPDQWRGDSLGHLGNKAVATPNIDRLVSEDAVSFSNAFCQNTVCTPSRCSFMTGLYPHVRGHRTMYHMLHEEYDETNMLKLLKDNGYFVWWGGKNDLVPGQSGFDKHCNIKFQPTEEDYKRWGLTPREGNHGGSQAWRGSPDGDNFFSFYKGKLDTNGEHCYCDGDWAIVLGAIDFIASYRGDKPLCVYMPLVYPHPPYCVEEPWFSMNGRGKVPHRAIAPDNWEGKPSILKSICQNQGLQNWPEDRWAELRATYYGMCSRTDHQFGMLIDALKKSGRYDRSSIFLFSDHGDFTGDYGLVEKTQNTFEDCLSRIPFIFKPPKNSGVKPRVCDAIVELVDFPATVYELTRIEPGYDHFGRSLLDLAIGKTDEHRDAAFCEGGRRFGEVQAMEWESCSTENMHLGLYAPRIKLQTTDEAPYHGKAVMCRTKTHKYVMRLYESDELYDLTCDPLEEHNRINDPALKDVLHRLKDRLSRWMLETCDVVPRKTDNR